MSEGDLARADSLNHIDAGGAYYTVVFPLAQAYRDRDVVAQQKLWPIFRQQIRHVHDPALEGEAATLAVFLLAAKDIDAAERALVDIADSARTPMERMGVAFVTSQLAAARGRPAEAVAAIPTQMPNRLSYWGLLLFEPFRQPSRAELQRFRDEVLRSDAPPAPPATHSAPIAAQVRLYWAALANCQLGDTLRALQQAQQIETLPAPAYWREALRALATDVRAFADVAHGDFSSALRRIESIPVDVPFDLLNTPANRELEKLWRGELLYRVGRYDEALQWFENVQVFPAQGMEVTPFYLLRRAQIHDRRGDTKQAALLYGQFLDYWKNPEPELQSFVREARGRLAVIQRKVD